MPDSDKKLIKSALNYFQKKVKFEEGVTKVTLDKKRMRKAEKIPVQYVQVIKGERTWLDRKLLKLRKKLSASYYNAIKESFIGTKRLTNKWILWQQKPIGGFERFQISGNRRKKRIREFLDLVWKNYKISNDNIFLLDEFERLRVMDFQLNKVVQMGEYSQFQKTILKQFW